MNWKQFDKLQIVHSNYLRVWCMCPFHEDNKRPNLSITISGKYKGCYKCWACSARGRLCGDQLKQLKVESGINYGPILPVKWDNYRKACVNNLKKFPLLKIQLAKELNVSEKSLDLWYLGFDGESFTLPMVKYDDVEAKKNNYYTGMQKRYFDGTKKCVPNSKLGYFLPRTLCYPNINDSNYEREDYTLFICEGWSDALAISDLGFLSIARPNWEFTKDLIFLIGIINKVYVVYKYVVVPDADKVGQRGAKAVNRLLQERHYSTSMFKFKNSKDIRDYILKTGKKEVRKVLLGY